MSTLEDRKYLRLKGLPSEGLGRTHAIITNLDQSRKGLTVTMDLGAVHEFREVVMPSVTG